MESQSYLVWRDEFVEDLMSLEYKDVTLMFLESLVLEAVEWAKVDAINEQEAKNHFLYFNRLKMYKLKFNEQYEIKNKALSIGLRAI